MKYRIMTTDGEWMYGEVRVLGNRLVIVLLDERGHERHDPTMELREETLGRHAGMEDYYEGDILRHQGAFSLYRLAFDGVFFWHLRDKDWDYVGEPIEDMIVMGNIHQNPELISNPDQLEAK